MDKLDIIYHDVKDSGGYAGVLALYRSAREKGLNISLKVVKEYLKRQDAYTLHKPARVHFRRNRTITYGKNELFQGDLIDMQNVAKHNSGYRYVLAVIDVFSKMAFVEPIKDKKGVSVAKALKNILETRESCKTFQSDHGKEFLASAVQNVLKSKGIKFFATYSSVKSAVIERFNRTIEGRIYRYFTDKNTLKYIDVIQQLVEAYNNSYHRSIKRKPIEVTAQNEKSVWQTLYSDLNPGAPTKYDFEIGDIVRISKAKGLFEKGYLPNYSEELFKVVRRIPKNPAVYKLQDLNSEPILGSFYALELALAYKDLSTCTFKIEKILRRRLKVNGVVELFVRWKGYPSKFNSWVTQLDIKKT